MELRKLSISCGNSRGTIARGKRPTRLHLLSLINLLTNLFVFLVIFQYWPTIIQDLSPPSSRKKIECSRSSCGEVKQSDSVFVGSEVLAAVVRKSCVTPPSPFREGWCFRGMCRLHLRGRKIRQARNQHEAGNLAKSSALKKQRIPGSVSTAYTALSHKKETLNSVHCDHRRFWIKLSCQYIFS
jgi:hypothetical protein